MLGEGVDSLNPFLGFQAPSYEMWGLTYDYLTGYSMKDMSPEPGLATQVDDVGRRQDVDLHGAQRGEVLRRGAADRGRRRLHLQPRARTARSRGTNWISYLKGVTR